MTNPNQAPEVDRAELLSRYAVGLLINNPDHFTENREAIWRSLSPQTRSVVAAAANRAYPEVEDLEQRDKLTITLAGVVSEVLTSSDEHVEIGSMVDRVFKEHGDLPPISKAS